MGGTPHIHQLKKNKCPPQNEFLLQVSTKIRFGGTIKFYLDGHGVTPHIHQLKVYFYTKCGLFT